MHRQSTRREPKTKRQLVAIRRNQGETIQRTATSYDLAATRDTPLDVEDDPLEPQQIEDRGDSEFAMEAGESEPVTYAEADDVRPGRIESLPDSLRLPLAFKLEYRKGDLAVITIDRRMTVLREERLAITRAIARHIEYSRVSLEKSGDWVNIPAIGTRANLLLLIQDEQKSDIEWLLKSWSRNANHYAIELPNGDIITPNTLLFSAGNGCVATRAAALRSIAIDTKPADRLSVFIGSELWSRAKINRFIQTTKSKVPNDKEESD